MPIPVTCQCGQELKIKDEFGGKIVECPKCRHPITVPSIALQQRFVEAQELIAGPSAEDRHRALDVFDEIKDPNAWALCLDQARGAHRELADHAARVLLANQPATRPYLERLLEDGDEALAQLRRLIKDQHCEPALDLYLQLLDQDRLAEDQVAAALDFLGWCKNPRAVDTLDRLRYRYPHFEQIIKSAIVRLEQPASGVSRLFGRREHERAGAAGFSLSSCLSQAFALGGMCTLLFYLLS